MMIMMINNMMMMMWDRKKRQNKVFGLVDNTQKDILPRKYKGSLD